MSEENVEIVRKAFAAFSRGDLEGTLDHLAPDLEFYPSGRFMDTQPIYHGREEWTNFWSTFHAAWEQITISIQRIENVGDRVLVLGTFHGTGHESGVEVSVEAAWLARVKDGLVAVMHSFASWDEALEAAGLSE
jgi:ketosteroid isomerase-like protein